MHVFMDYSHYIKTPYKQKVPLLSMESSLANHLQSIRQDIYIYATLCMKKDENKINNYLDVTKVYTCLTPALCAGPSKRSPKTFSFTSPLSSGISLRLIPIPVISYLAILENF